MSSARVTKPKQKFEINFQQNISDQLGQMTTAQLIRLFFVIASLLPINFELMSDYQKEFKEFLKKE